MSFPNAVRITETPAWYEIVNGLTGVRIARAGPPDGHPILAPVQGILYRDGTWTAVPAPISSNSPADPPT
jgi:hypothetical protein